MHWLLIGYMFLFIHRPFEIWPFLADLRIELVYMLGTGMVWLLAPGKRWLSNPLHTAVLVFAVAVLVCWLASPWATEGFETVDRYAKLLVFYVMLVTVVHDEKGLRRLLLAFLMVMALYMLHSLWEYRNGRMEYRQSITRMLGVDRSLGDPNSFAASVLYALPFVIPFWTGARSWLMRGFLAGYLLLSGTCIVLTGSRSAFVGLLVLGLLSIWQGRKRMRWLALACLLAPLSWVALPASLQTRFETIIHPEVGPAIARESAEGRIVGFYTGLALWGQYPLTGCGPGAWRPASRSLLESHNLYGQLLGEMGTVGALAFAALLCAFWINLRRVRRSYRIHPHWQDDFLAQVARAVGLAVVILLLEGNFGHNLFRFTWLWYGGFLIIACHCVRQRAAAEAGADGTWDPAPAGYPAWAPGVC
jgi:O-antigen ligase